MSNSASAQPKLRLVLGRRAAGKDRTRQKIMATAKRIFSAIGYERATIRDIAADCGVSTGAVFASFSSKAELFTAVLYADRLAAYAVIGETMREALKDRSAQIDEVLFE